MMLVCPRGHEFDPMVIVRDAWNAFLDFVTWVLMNCMLFAVLVLLIDLVMVIGQLLTHQIRTTLLWVGLGMFFIPIIIYLVVVVSEKNNTLPSRH
jgi:hypothetical protein